MSEVVFLSRDVVFKLFFELLPTQSVFVVARTSKLLNEFLNDPELWKYVCTYLHLGLKEDISQSQPNEGGNRWKRLYLDYLLKDPIWCPFFGHVDSGKSTLIGHLKHALGLIPQNTWETTMTEANNMGKGSFRYAFLTDSLRPERERGITIITHNNFVSLPTPQRVEMNLLDTPGHRDFFKNTLRSSYKAHLAVLVVAAGTGEFEAGWSNDYGCTKGFLHVMHTFGLKNVIVVINKMDSLRYSPLSPQQRYDEIVSTLLEYCSQHSLFKEDQITFIPMSAWKGDNVVVRSNDMPWFQGPTFWEALKKAQENLSVVLRSPLLHSSVPNAPLYPMFSPLSLNVKDAYKYVKTGKVNGKVHRDWERFVEGDEIKHPGVIVSARVTSGMIEVGQTVNVWPPLKTMNELKVIDMFVITSKGKTRCSSSRAGEEVVLSLQVVPPYTSYPQQSPPASFFRHMRNATLSSGPMPTETSYLKILLKRVSEDTTTKKRALRPGATHFAICGSKRLVFKILKVSGEEVHAQVVYPVFVAAGDTLFIQNGLVVFKGIIIEVSQQKEPVNV